MIINLLYFVSYKCIKSCIHHLILFFYREIQTIDKINSEYVEETREEESDGDGSIIVFYNIYCYTKKNVILIYITTILFI